MLSKAHNQTFELTPQTQKRRHRIDPKIESMADDELMRLTVEVGKQPLRRFKDDANYRAKIEKAWGIVEPVYRMTELFRMNLVEHCAPQKKRAIPRAPAYGRINRWCGAMDYDLIEKNGYYTIMNRRDIADALRAIVNVWARSNQSLPTSPT